MDDLTVTVVIPTIHARPDLLRTAIDSVMPTLRPDDALIVADRGTFAENCNTGAAHAATDLLVFLNDDCKVDQDDWLDRLREPFADPRVGVVGCRLIYPNGQLQHTGVYFTDEDGILTAHNRTWDVPSGPVDAVTGACLAVRKHLYEELGGFDEAFRNGYEDVDFCLRVRQASHLIWYTADCTLIHHESQSGAARWEYVGHNVARLQSLWTVTSGDAD